MPEASITTDIIVGFPGESEEYFQETIDLAKEVKFSAAFTYKYSKRPGTPAATMEDQVDPAIVGERYTRLHGELEKISFAVNKKAIGSTVEVMVADHPGRKDDESGRVTGRSRDFRLVHANYVEGCREFNFFGQINSFLKISFGLSWESHNNVSCN